MKFFNFWSFLIWIRIPIADPNTTPTKINANLDPQNCGTCCFIDFPAPFQASAGVPAL
jgi:hypothetical protein